MIGLKYIAKTFRIRFSEIADELDVSKSTVNDWLKGKRNIPEKRLKQLADYFKLDENYFQKELSEEEELEIMKENVLRYSQNEDREETFVDELGEKHTVINRVNDSEEVIHLINQKQVSAKLLNSISNLLRGDEGYNNPDNISFFRDLIDLLKDNVSRRIVFLFIGALSQKFGTTFYVGKQNEKEVEFINEVKDLLLKLGFQRNEK